MLGKTFFPREGSPALQAYFLAFTVFAVGYFARPFGGIFGHISDKYGHKKSFLLTITLVDGPSCFYDSYIAFISKRWYSLATMLFIVLRIIQGGLSLWNYILFYQFWYIFCIDH